MEGVRKLPPFKASAPEIAKLSPLIPLALQNTLRGEHPLELSFGHSERWIYEVNAAPVGLLIISVNLSSYTAVVEWLSVDVKHGNRGIASQLLSAAIKALRQLNVKYLSFYFPKNTHDTPATEALMLKFGASPSRHFVYKYKFDAPRFNPTWISRVPPLPEGYSLCLWKEISVRERADLEHRFDQFQIPFAVSPFANPHLIDLASSVAIREKDKVVGWAINRWVFPDSIEFSALYVDPELSASSGLGPAALIRSIHLVKNCPTTKFAWMTIRSNDPTVPTWENFIQKRLAKEALEIQDLHEAFLDLT